MKRYYFIAVLLLLASACSTDKAEIKKAAYLYADATANYDIDRAEQYCTHETSQSTLKKARVLMKMIDTSFIISDTPAEVSIIACGLTSDSTAYAVYHKVTPIKDFTDSLNLSKRDGRWLVHDPIQKITKKAPEQPTFEVADSVLIDGEYRPLIRKRKAPTE